MYITYEYVCMYVCMYAYKESNYGTALVVCTCNTYLGSTHTYRAYRDSGCSMSFGSDFFVAAWRKTLTAPFLLDFLAGGNAAWSLPLVESEHPFRTLSMSIHWHKPVVSIVPLSAHRASAVSLN